MTQERHQHIPRLGLRLRAQHGFRRQPLLQQPAMPERPLVLKRNQFGVTVGGPIVIPKIVNGHNKLFFFFSYEGQRQTPRTLPSGKVTTYTPAEANGDFSALGPHVGYPHRRQFLQNLIMATYYQSNPTLAARHYRSHQDRSGGPAYFTESPDPYFGHGVPLSASAEHGQLQRISGQDRLQHQLQRYSDWHVHTRSIRSSAISNRSSMWSGFR